MSYKCAFLGCGPRAQFHADAYQHITRGKIVAACDLDRARLDGFAVKFNVPAKYTDIDQMLAKEKPDVVHLVTPPTIRVEPMTRLANAGVPAVIVEKPIAIGGDDYLAMRRLGESSRTKFIVNHQLRFHPRVLTFLKDINDGAIGQVKFMDATSGLPMAGQGVHVLDLAFAFNGYAPATSVFGACSGYDDIDGRHPTAKSAEFLITFANGTRVALMSGAGAPMEDPVETWKNKRIAVYGTHGFRHWKLDGWESSRPDGSVAAAAHDYGAEDVLGQAGLTNATFDWLDNDKAIHPCNLATSLDEWRVIVAGYTSAMERRAIDFPFEPAPDLLPRFKAYVTSKAV